MKIKKEKILNKYNFFNIFCKKKIIKIYFKFYIKKNFKNLQKFFKTKFLNNFLQWEIFEFFIK